MTGHRCFLVAAIIGTFFCGQLAFAAYRYSLTDLGSPTGTQAVAYSINNAGAVVGWCWSTDLSTDALLWQAGQPPVRLAPGGGFQSSTALAINDAGSVIGWGESPDPASVRQYYLWSAAQGAQPAGDSTLRLTSINSAGLAVGAITPPGATFSTAASYDALHGIVPLMISGATASEAVKINNPGQVLVLTQSSDGAQGFILQPDGSLTAITAAAQELLHLADLNDAGAVVGSIRAPSRDVTHAFLWNAATGMQDLTPGSGIASDAAAVNNLGQVIGWESDVATAQSFPFLYDNGHANNLYALLDASGAGWSNLILYDINDAGQIVGEATGTDGQLHAILLTPDGHSPDPAVPEPGTLGLSLLGGLLLNSRRRHSLG